MSCHYDAIIVGGGLAGTSTALWLSQTRRILLLCGREPGASQVATGIVNPFAGRRLRPVWHAEAALADLERTVALAGGSQYYSRTGVLRPANSQSQNELFSSGAFLGSTWLAAGAARERFPGIRAVHGALFTPGGMVNTVQFLRTAQKQLEDLGATVLRDAELAAWHASHSRATVVLNSGARFTASVIVLSLGYGYREFEALKQLNLHAVKGQIVKVAHVPGLKLELPICGEGYVAPGNDALTLGTTYERDFVDVAPTSRSQRAIVGLTSLMVPALAKARVLGAAAGVRVGVPGTRLPMVGPIGHRVWIFTGLGSKGLLFAPHIARQLPSWLEDAEAIPPEIRVRLRNSNR